MSNAVLTNKDMKGCKVSILMEGLWVNGIIREYNILNLTRPSSYKIRINIALNLKKRGIRPVLSQRRCAGNTDPRLTNHECNIASQPARLKY